MKKLLILAMILCLSIFTVISCTPENEGNGQGSTSDGSADDGSGAPDTDGTQNNQGSDADSGKDDEAPDSGASTDNDDVTPGSGSGWNPDDYSGPDVSLPFVPFD